MAAIAPGNLWFLVALFAALLFIMDEFEFQPIEGYIIVTLGNGITLTVLGGTQKLNPSTLREGSVLSFSRYILWGLWRGLSTYFWWKRLDTATPSRCSALGWLFVGTNLMGWLWIFHKVLNIMEWVAWTILVVPYIVALLALLRALHRLDPAYVGVSKTAVFCDYFFVPVGELHDVVFGSPVR
jgi:hypothetical protein